MKKLLLKKLKQDFAKAGFDLLRITFLLNYIEKTMITDGEQTNGKNVRKEEPLNESSAFVEGLTKEVGKYIDYDTLDAVNLICDLITFEVQATLFYNKNGEKKKTTLAI